MALKSTISKDPASQLVNQLTGSTISHQYGYSFSGADIRAFTYFPASPAESLHQLRSLHTLSISIHEAKAPARSLGYRTIKGFARSTRTIAGSMILTVVNDNPLRELLQHLSETDPLPSWSIDKDQSGVGDYKNMFQYTNRLAGLIPPFNMLIEAMAENSPIVTDLTNRNLSQTAIGAGALLLDIEFIDESLVLSVNDMVSEVTLSYVARDYKPITAQNIPISKIIESTTSEIDQKNQELIAKCFNSSGWINTGA